MATNIRGHRVVAPGCIAEYDRIDRSSPFGIVVGGVTLWIGGTIAAIGISVDGGSLAVLLLLAILGGGALTWRGIVLALRNEQRLNIITRNLNALRTVAVFDEEAASDQNMWEAATLAAEREQLEWRVDDLTGASIRSDSFEQELSEKESRMQELTLRITALVL